MVQPPKNWVGGVGEIDEMRIFIFFYFLQSGPLALAGVA